MKENDAQTVDTFHLMAHKGRVMQQKQYLETQVWGLGSVFATTSCVHLGIELQLP